MDAPQKTPLLVDDDKHVLITLRDFLTASGYRVVSAVSAEDALKKLKKETPDLVILDIAMPGMGGIGFLKTIAQERSKHFPILVLTARATMQDFFGSLDVDGFIAKPCTEAELLGAITRILGRQPQPAPEPAAAAAAGRVLLAEDDDRLAADIRGEFERAGFQVEVVQTGPAVLERALQFKPDIVVLKEILPKMNGSAVAPLLKTMPGTSHTPIVLYDQTRTVDETVKYRYRVPQGVDEVVWSVESRSILAAARKFVGR